MADAGKRLSVAGGLSALRPGYHYIAWEVLRVLFLWRCALSAGPARGGRVTWPLRMLLRR